ncbi:tetratricopeptide repeat protein, partial [Nonomuraea rhizosphaerae]|uniref:tetratricopeptide repeat protein n=1 Tax=Nonomuraea rhizosphaerae TaxID=2665663 RepID=UPI001C5F6216
GGVAGGAEPDARRLAEQLTAAGLLSVVSADGGDCRYRPHDLVALYARELAAHEDPRASGESMDRMLDALIAATESMYPHLPWSLEGLPLDRAREHHPAYVTAVPAVEPGDSVRWVHAQRSLLLSVIEQGCRFGHVSKAERLSGLVAPTLAAFGGFEELLRTMAMLRDAARSAGDALAEWRAEYARAALLLTRQVDESARLYARCAEEFERLDAPVEQAQSLACLAFARSIRGHVDEGSSLAAIEIAGTLGRPAISALAFRNHAEVLLRSGRRAEALERYRESLACVQGLDNNLRVRGDLSRRYSRCALRLGDLDEARTSCRQAILLAEAAYDSHGLAWCLNLKGQILLADERPREALEAAERSRRLMAETGDAQGSATVALVLARARLAANRRR